MTRDTSSSAIPPLPDGLPQDEEEAEATAFVPRVPPPPGEADGAAEMAEPPDRPRTNTGLEISALPEGSDTNVGRAGRAARQAADLRRRVPAPRRNRPTLLPGDMPPKLPSASRSVDPGLVAPVRPALDQGRAALVGRAREASDVIQTFRTSPDGALANPPSSPAPVRDRPRPLRPKNLQRKPAPVAQHAVTASPLRPAPPAAAAVLPLQPDVLAIHIADQRRRLGIIDGFARALEVAAGIVGTLALACLIAALVSILVGSDVSVLSASAALVGGLCALALTLLMVVAAVGLRQIAHNSAQLAALLEALSGYRR